MKKIIIIISVIIISSLLFILSQDSKPKKIKIGLVAALSGKYSLLGTNIKDGVSLAFDEINYNINGVNIDLIEKDDKQDSKANEKAINELINQNVKIIIGNGTSSMAEQSINILKNHKDVLLFSPTVSSDKFSQIDDNFIRVQVPNNIKRFNTLSKEFLLRKYSKIISVYDPNNLVYSKSYVDIIEQSFVNLGGEKFIEHIPTTTSLDELVKKVKKNDVDIIILSTNTIDSAKIIQYLKLKNVNKAILCSDWTRTQRFVEDGGKSVEGVLFYTSYDMNSSQKEYLDFVQKFEKKYNKKPSLFNLKSYQTAKIIIETLKKDINVLSLKSNILNKSKFDTVLGEIKFDKFGEVQREQFLVHIKNGKFVKLEN